VHRSKADTERVHEAVQADIREALIHERWLDILVVCVNEPPVSIEGDGGGDGVEVEEEEGGTVDGEKGEYVGEVDILCAAVNGEIAQGEQ
jgi:hypothetical protein